jgi:hypothetical protein
MENELIALEEEGWRALAAGEGAGFYAEHCTDDALMIFPGGMVMDRDAAVQGLRDAPGWAEYTLADWRAAPLGDDAGVVVYRAEARREGEAPYVALMSSTYVRDGGTWRLALHQQTPV